jgi:polynucleotide 5'-hydroxyl-kinase GRC3/NOL9
LRQTIQPNKTLIVDGPASVQLVTGKAEVFGNPLKEMQRAVVREGKRTPFFVSETAVFEMVLGANAAVQEAEGSTVPESWNKPIQTVLGLEKKPAVILVLGASDAGKSSFCTYMLNKMVGANCKVAVLDGDLGQSDIGPCASVGYAVATKPVSELYDLRLQNGYFIGVTSPAAATSKTLEGLTAMMNEACQRQADYILVNTDGFVSGEAAISYKLSLIKELKPDVVVGVQMQDELEPLMSYLGGGGVLTVEPSPALSLRSAEKRKSLREMTYAKYLRKSKLQCYPLSQLTVEPKNAVPKSQEPEKGVLVGLYGRGSRFLGIGVLRAVNIGRRTLKVQTSVSSKPARLIIGKVLLNRKLQEIQD